MFSGVPHECRQVLSGFEDSLHVLKLLRIDFALIDDLLPASFEKQLNLLFIVENEFDVLILIDSPNKPSSVPDFLGKLFEFVDCYQR